MCASHALECAQEELRTAVLVTVRDTLLAEGASAEEEQAGGSSSSAPAAPPGSPSAPPPATPPPPTVELLLTRLIEETARRASALCEVADPLGLPAGSLPPTPPPEDDRLPWQPLEAALHVLGALAPGLASIGPTGAALLASPLLAGLVGRLGALPPRRALWREAAVVAGALSVHLDAGAQAALLLSCAAAALRTLGLRAADEEDDASLDDGDEPYVMTGEPADRAVQATMGGALSLEMEEQDAMGSDRAHPGAVALWRLCAAGPARVLLAAQPGVFRQSRAHTHMHTSTYTYTPQCIPCTVHSAPRSYTPQCIPCTEHQCRPSSRHCVRAIRSLTPSTATTSSTRSAGATRSRSRPRRRCCSRCVLCRAL